MKDSPDALALMTKLEFESRAPATQFVDGLEFTIHDLHTRSKLNQRGKWTVSKATAAERRATRVHWFRTIKVPLIDTGPAPTRPRVPVICTLTRIAPKPLDEGEGDRAALKGVRDEVAVLLGLSKDNGWEVEWRYQQEKGEPKQYAVRITIEPRRMTVEEFKALVEGA